MYVDKNGAKSWRFRFYLNGKAREMGLGTLSTCTLSEARNKVIFNKNKIAEGIDPIEERKKITEAFSKNKETPTFSECAIEYIEANRKTCSQWINTINAYANPIIGNLDISAVTTDHIIKILDLIWYEITETATRVRRRIERILDRAAIRGYRSGNNPARWNGHLENIYPHKEKVQKH